MDLTFIQTVELIFLLTTKTVKQIVVIKAMNSYPVYTGTSASMGGIPHSIVINVLDYDIVVNEFEF